MQSCHECGCETTDFYRVFLPPKAHAKPEQQILCAVDCYPRYVRELTNYRIVIDHRTKDSDEKMRELRYYKRPPHYSELRT